MGARSRLNEGIFELEEAVKGHLRGAPRDKEMVEALIKIQSARTQANAQHQEPNEQPDSI